MSALQNFPYLWTTVASSLPVLAVIILDNRRRKTVLLSALAGLVPALFSPAFEARYWNPRRLLGGGLGIEDFLCGFMMAGFIWWAVLLTPLFREINPDNGRFWKRYATIILPGIAASFGAYFAGMDGLTLALIGPVVTIGLLALLAPELWPASLFGGVVFPLVWWAWLNAAFLAWPGFCAYWNMEVWFSQSVGGVPLSELVWACAFGACWPPLMAWCMGAKPAVLTSAARR